MNENATDQELSQAVGQELAGFVASLLVLLDEKLDKRLVGTFERTLQAIVELRHNRYGLLLSELGGYILTPAQAPAGTKRLSNLLRSKRWQYKVISRFLWQRASRYVDELAEAGKSALLIWDESVIEKAESIALEGLCPVRSSKAARLKRIKPGYFNPPGGRPIFVPGMQWLSLMVIGFEGAPVVAAMRWWTTRGKFARRRRPTAAGLLRRCAAAWGQRVIHVWDRGYASSPWLGQAFRFQVRFILRWKKKQHLVDNQGKRNAWKITRGKRSLDHRYIWDNRRRCWRKTGLIYVPVRHPDYDAPLWLVVARPGKNRLPWYLLTNLPITSIHQAWRVVFAYARRWQVEMAFRFTKTELAMESPRLWSWHNRLKLMLMVTLVYAFLLSLLHTHFQTLRHLLLRRWCHRTGKRYRDVSIPLYRLRSALSRLWLAHPPPISSQNSG
jgi:hypothetical protein